MFRVSHLLLPIILALFYHDTDVHSLEINCTSFQPRVPKPQLKYMLSGHLHVIWQENETIGYKAHICCSKLLSYSYSGCSDTCPQFQAISSCTTASNGSGTKSRQCSMRVFEYFEYKIYLSGEQDGCELTGKMIKIRPRLRFAWPDPVPSLNVYSLYNGLLVEWTKSHRYMQLLYSLRCEQLPLAYNKLKVLKKSINKDLKSYTCCIRVHLPYFGTSRYSEVCKASQSKEITSKFHCDHSHECKIAEVDKLQYFSIHFKPNNTGWPNIPPAMVLQIKKRNARHRRKENLLIA